MPRKCQDCLKIETGGKGSALEIPAGVCPVAYLRLQAKIPFCSLAKKGNLKP